MISKSVKITLLIILSLFFITFNVFFITSKGIENTVLNIDFYEEVIDETSISGEIKKEVLMSTKKATGNQEEITNSINETISEEWIEEKSLNTIDSTLKWFKGHTNKLETEIELSDKKEELERNISEVIVKEIPNEIDPINEETKNRLEKLKKYYFLFQFLPYLILIIFLVIYILLSTYNSPYWIGSSIAISGIIALITLTIGKISLTGIIPEMIDKGVIKSIISIGFRKSITYPIASLVLGILIIGSGFLIKKIKYNEPNNKK